MSKRISFVFGAAMVALLAAGPVLAQTATAPNTAGTARTDNRNDGFDDWGLLGLLGLAGLAPLFMRKDREGNVHTDTRR